MIKKAQRRSDCRKIYQKSIFPNLLSNRQLKKGEKDENFSPLQNVHNLCRPIMPAFQFNANFPLRR